MVPSLGGLLARVIRRKAAPQPPNTAFQATLAEAGLSFEAWHGRRRSARRLYVDGLSGEALQARFPDQARATVAAAEEVLGHRFDLLGSGPFVPLDPDREATASGYRPIDWYLDPVSGMRFPRGVPYREWDLYTMRPGQADIKLPWELARCQHWAVLGQAYRLTGDDRYASEIFDELEDFRSANPVGIGIHWTCTMDVAVRALNWAIGLSFVSDCDHPPAIWERAYEVLFEHGVFIEQNLENTYEVTSNHFLSNVVGLGYVGEVFCDVPSGGRWRGFARAAVEEEIGKQVLDDGADFESSVPYHRLVTELFLGVARLAQVAGEPLSASFHQRLRKMVEFLLSVLRPDGLMPQVGDADDGRLHVFTGWGRWPPQDARHLLAPAALVLGERSWLRHAGEGGLWEAAWWGFDVAGLEAVSVPPPAVFRLHDSAGLAVMREAGTYVLVTNGVVGTKGFGNHKHNDQLAFELHLDGIPLLVDPGSYVYTADFAARNLFRSTAYHNTLGVDGEEQNELRPEWIFRMFEKAHPRHLAFEVTDERAEYRGSHDGYGRLDEPVVHERTLRLLRRSGALLIADRVIGAGTHRLVWHFHCAPGVLVSPGREGGLELRGGGRVFRLDLPAGLEPSVGEAWYSPSYGVRRRCAAVDISTTVELAGEQCWWFAVALEEWFAEGSHREMLSSLRATSAEMPAR
jgi:hypothetical protein